MDAELVEKMQPNILSCSTAFQGIDRDGSKPGVVTNEVFGKNSRNELGI